MDRCLDTLYNNLTRLPSSPQLRRTSRRPLLGKGEGNTFRSFSFCKEKVGMRSFLWIPLFLLIVACGPGEEPTYDPCTDETIIDFPDPEMAGCIRTRAGLLHDGSPIKTSDVCWLKSISCISSGITDLTGLEKMPWVKELELSGNTVISFEPLKTLVDLELLRIHGGGGNLEPFRNLDKMVTLGLSGKNGIRDISPLQGMKALEELYLDENEDIESLYVLEEAINLKALVINNNKVSDISVVKSMLSLEILFVKKNCITDFSPIEYLKEHGKLTNVSGATPEEQDYARCQ